MRRSKRETLFKTCKRCGRPLSDRASRKRGYGPGCLAQLPHVQRAILEREGQLSFPIELLEPGRARTGSAELSPRAG